MRLPTLYENTKLHITSETPARPWALHMHLQARRSTSNYNGKMTVIKRWPHKPRRNKCSAISEPGTMQGLRILLRNNYNSVLLPRRYGSATHNKDDTPANPWAPPIQLRAHRAKQ